MIVLALLATVLSGMVGDGLNATILIYSEQAINVTVENKTVKLYSGVNRINIPVVAENGVHEMMLSVVADDITYTLPLTVVGKRSYGWLWWLLLIPVAVLIAAIRVRRIRIGSS